MHFSFTADLLISINGVDMEREVEVTGSFTRGHKPEPWGASPDPGAPDEYSFDPLRIELGRGEVAYFPATIFSEEQIGALKEEAAAAMAPDPDRAMEAARDDRLDMAQFAERLFMGPAR